MVKRRKEVPAIPPFLDQWGRPTYANPFGKNRHNPALDATEPPVSMAPPRPVQRVTEADVQVRGWEARERHLAPAEPPRPLSPAAPGPVTPDAILERLRRAKSVAAAEAVSRSEPAVVPEPEAPAPVAPAAVDAPPRPQVGDAPTPPEVVDAEATPPRTRAERLVEDLATRRVRNRRRARRAGSVAAAGAAVFGVTAAYGFWTGGADAGSRVAKVTILPVAAEATAGMANSPLLPGRRGNVKLRVDNPNGFAVTLTSVSGGPFPSRVDGAPGCTIANSGVTFLPPHSLNESIPAKSSSFVRLVDAAQMGPGAASVCRGHTFTIPVSVTVTTHKG